eukprot:gnl/MRDRNA2_/MRDRNA2_98720_c0_seq1.p1 gnl/MRDRNA2_/MRDRNA2_98720_c0~~gnl/MRDRNA2_/MRDRNA2_98720_c0_seq1.p1  ORF type:complete len:689 (+),score=128.47 gnl/MRDRNA2_/MRDRNA2_98720_c0_seq1:267-2069(+)
MAIPWNFGIGDTLSVSCNRVDYDTGTPGSFRCINSTWQQEVAAPSCLAARQSAWRLKNTEELPHGWWVHDLKFFSDNECKKHIGTNQILQSFAYGPAVSDGPPKEALDNDRVSIWKAPCVDAGQTDLCGCMTQLNEGYSVSSKRCVPGEITSGYAEEVCVNTGVKKQNANNLGANNDAYGCPNGGVTIGVELRMPQEVACIGILQDGQKKRNYQQLDAKLPKAAGSLALEQWNGHGWEEVRRWTDLNKEGNWEYLPLRDSCSEYELPTSAPAWVEILGTANGHGAKRTIRCADGDPKQVQVECIEGAWSKMPLLLCDAPSLPLVPPPQPTQAPKSTEEETGGTMALSIFLLLLMAVLIICLLYIARTAAQWYGERKQRHLLYAVPEKDIEMPATMPTKPQRVGRASGERPLSAMERRRKELGTLSSSEFKAKAAMLREQVAECVDNCASPKFKKEVEKRKARDSSPTKISRNGDGHSSPGAVSFGQRKRDLGSAPKVPPAPASLPTDKKKRSMNSSSPSRQEHKRNSFSPFRRQRPDESRIDRRGEPPPQEPVQHLPPPPPVPPPPGSSSGPRNPARQLPSIPRGSGGMSKAGSDFMLNF